MPCPKTGGYREGFLESGGDIANIGAEGADLTVKLVVVSAVQSCYKILSEFVGRGT